MNALWNGRLPIDVTAGIDPEPPWTHRYRQCVFVRTRSPCDLPSALVAVGPFGDVKNYNGRDFYISWYPVGLDGPGRPSSNSSATPLPTGALADEFIARVRAALEPLMPGIGRLFDDAESAVVHGGFVFAQGSGSLDDPRSGLHRRDRYGVQRRGSYYSVDTGKYSTAPWLARELASADRRLMGEQDDRSGSRRGTRGSPPWCPPTTALEFITRTLDSLAAQTWTNLEILIGDDCSTDDTLDDRASLRERAPGHAGAGARCEPRLAAQLERPDGARRRAS